MSLTNNGKRNNTDNNPFNQLDYHIDYRLTLLNTIKICAVTAVYDDNTCDVKPLVPELDTKGNAVAPQVLKKLPIMQVQGGVAGLIIKYSAGDIVLCGFADRDITAVKAKRTQAVPLTAGITPLSSGVVLGAVLFKNPQIFVKITDQIYLTGANVIISNDIQSASNASIAGNMEVGGTITAGDMVDAQGYSVASQPGITKVITSVSPTAPLIFSNGILVE